MGDEHGGSTVKQPTDKKHASTLFDFMGTAFLSSLYTFTIFCVLAVLARVLEESQFLEYSVISRYLGFLVIAANLGVAYSFIRFSEGHDTEGIHSLARLCRRYLLRAVAVFAVVWAAVVVIWFRADWQSMFALCLVYLWVASQAQHNLTTPYTRRLHGFNGYVKLTFCTRVFAPLIGVTAAVFSESYKIHFFTFAVVSIAIQQLVWRSGKAPTANPADYPVMAFSRSRWVENLIRSVLPVMFVVAAQMKGGAHFAGSVAIIFTVAKSIESLMQSLVTVVMLRVSAKSQKSAGLLASVGIALGLALLVYLSRDLVFLFITLFLGDTYAYLQEEAWTVLVSSGAIISLSLLRGLNDNKLDQSPLVWINLGCLLLVPFIVYFADNLQEVAYGIVLIQVLRYALYGLSLKRQLD